jgi:large subunit ribosomal protein L21
MYALMTFKGKQYRAETGKTIKVDLVDAEPGSKIDIDSVLLVSGESVSVGTPFVQGAKVSAVVKEHGKDKKIVVFKYRPKKDYRRKRGHRQRYSVLQIENIQA